MNEVDEIVDFAIKYGGGIYSKTNEETLRQFIKKHLEYGTCMIIRDKAGICAICRWNWISEFTLKILDLIVRVDKRNPKFLREMLALGVSKNPKCLLICFDRATKYPDRNTKIISVNKFLKRRSKNGRRYKD